MAQETTAQDTAETAPAPEATSADMRDAVLSDWPDDAPDPAEKPAAETADDTKAEDTETADESEDTDKDADAEDDDETESDGDDADEDAADKPDAVAAKRIAAIQAEERRAKLSIAGELQKLEAERTEMRASVKAVEQFRQFAARAKRDPVGVLTALGLGPDDFEETAKMVYGHSTAAQANPKLREQAVRLQRERGTIGEVEELRGKLEKIEAEREAERAQQAQEREVTAYVGRVQKAVNGQAPLLSALTTKNPDAAREQIVLAALHLHEQTGIEPDPADVIAEVERRERQLLIDRGIEPPPTGKKADKKSKKAGTKKNTEKAAETKKADPDKKITTKPPDEDDSDEWKLREQILNDPEWVS